MYAAERMGPDGPFQIKSKIKRGNKNRFFPYNKRDFLCNHLHICLIINKNGGKKKKSKGISINVWVGYKERVFDEP